MALNYYTTMFRRAPEEVRADFVPDAGAGQTTHDEPPAGTGKQHTLEE
mgnify:CR=1 FL=1